MGFQIVEKVGRAGNFNKRKSQADRWDQQYGENNWEIVYFYLGKIYLREEALEEFYNKSYYEYLNKNSNIAKELCLQASEIYNPHAEATTGVDLQCPAVSKALEKLRLKLAGNRRIAIGTWNSRNGVVFPPISHKLSPFRVPLWCDPAISVEKFWQDYKYLAVKNNKKG